MFSFSTPDSDSRKVALLKEIEQLFPWDSVTKAIDHSFSKKQTGRNRIPSIIMIKMVILQYIFGLSDETVQEDIFDRKSYYSFIGDELLQQRWVPDATTLCKFRKHLMNNQLDTIIFDTILSQLEQKWAFLKRWTVVDSTIIQAPSSTKNKNKERDPEMKSTKKGSNYYFGMKVHQWTDADTGIVHNIVCTPANESDMNHCEDLLHGAEKYVWWDKWYHKKERKQAFRAKWIYYGILDKPARWSKLSHKQQKLNKKKQSIKAKVELPFWIFKRWWWNTKVRYKWLRKNTSRITIWFALWNLFLGKRYLERLQV
jgi:transposase, IS5 family